MLRPPLHDWEDLVVIQLVLVGNRKVIQRLKDLSHDNHMTIIKKMTTL